MDITKKHVARQNENARIDVRLLCSYPDINAPTRSPTTAVPFHRATCYSAPRSSASHPPRDSARPGRPGSSPTCSPKTGSPGRPGRCQTTTCGYSRPGSSCSSAAAGSLPAKTAIRRHHDQQIQGRWGSETARRGSRRVRRGASWCSCRGCRRSRRGRACASSEAAC